MYSTIENNFRGISNDLKGIDAFRYQRNISGGMQEYMEAVLFQHYLETQKIMNLEAASTKIPDGIMLTYEDYTLGLFDMTGELMRFAITYMATNGKLPGIYFEASSKTTILTDMQSMRNHLELMDVSGSYFLSKDAESKLKTTRSSVEKVENGVYSMIVRGKERPKGWRPDISLNDGARENDQVESY